MQGFRDFKSRILQLKKFPDPRQIQEITLWPISMSLAATSNS